VWFKADYAGLYEAIPGFAVGMLLTFGVSWLTSRKKSRPECNQSGSVAL